jgi:hypothetical protein
MLNDKGPLGPHFYTAKNASILIKVIKVYYRGPDYMKAKCELYSKYGKELIQKKTFKLYYKRIKHWEKYEL